MTLLLAYIKKQKDIYYVVYHYREQTTYIFMCLQY
jgi:hypothetical protein